MLTIRLVNLPFAAYHLPSLGLTQLKGVLARRLGDRADVEICYATHLFARYTGLDLFEEIKGGDTHLSAGFAEWLFRQEAFPEAPDNAEAYFRRYYPVEDEATARFKRTIRNLRPGLGRMLERIIDTYALDTADVVGCTSMFFETNAAIALARRLKARNPDIVTLLGGANCESPSGEELARQVDVLDYVFSGPGLVSLPRLAECLLDGDLAAADQIDGVFTKRNCGYADPDDPSSRFLHVAPMGDELNINQLVELDYDDFFASLEATFPEHEIKAVLPFETSRGCWWGERSHCTFCGLNKSTMGYRAMTPANALALIRSLFRYAGKATMLMCVDNILQRTYIDEVFPHLDTPEENTIFYQLKANLTEEEIRTMSEARVKAITPGIESLSSSTLKLMAKGVTAFHNLRVMKYCRMHDVFPGWNLLVGSPGEGDEVYERYVEILPRLAHLPPPQAVFNIKFNRYSPYFMRPEEHGLDLEPVDHYRFVFPWDDDVLEQVAYDFQDTHLHADYRLAMARWIDRLQERVGHWRRLWYEGGEETPKLHLREEGGEHWVFDSRGEEPREYPIDEAALAVLEALETQRKPSSLAAAVEESHGLGAELVEERLAWLDARGLLFEEDGLYLSLVLPAEPPPMSRTDNGLGVVRRRRAGSDRPAIKPTRRRVRKVAS